MIGSKKTMSQKKLRILLEDFMASKSVTPLRDKDISVDFQYPDDIRLILLDLSTYNPSLLSVVGLAEEFGNYSVFAIEQLSPCFFSVLEATLEKTTSMIIRNIDNEIFKEIYVDVQSYDCFWKGAFA